VSAQPEELQIPVEREDDFAVVRPAGYLNALAGDQIDKVCRRLLDDGTRYVIINFHDVSMVNTIGISVLVGIIEKVLDHNGLVYFTELGPTDRQIFEVLNLTTVALIFDTDDEARTHIERDREAVRRAEQS
jgi:anti-anti-sigma factor